MASAPSDTPKLKKKNLPKIESTAYSKTTLNEQVVFAIHFLEQYGVAVTVEEVVSTCFRLFPQSFSLKHYTRWPDSALVIRRLNDAREKGFVKGNPQEGFALKYAGSKLAERTAKVLGLVKPAPAKKKPSLSKVKAKKVVIPAPKLVKPKKKNVSPIKKTLSGSISAKQTVESKSVPPKKTVGQVPAIKKPSVKLQPVKTKTTKKTVRPVVVVARKAVEKKRKDIPVVQKAPVKAQKIKPRKTQPVQMAMMLPAKEVQSLAPPAKKQSARKNTSIPQLTRLQAIQPEMIIPAKVKPALIAAVSKEEKAKAEKIVRAMERSDAYKLYSKNGHGLKPSEFDFRNMLFATMESTPETLARNVNLFKGSAAIHNRQDLITFLDYCETNFASLLKPSVKKIIKKK